MQRETIPDTKNVNRAIKMNFNCNLIEYSTKKNTKSQKDNYTISVDGLMVRVSGWQLKGRWFKSSQIQENLSRKFLKQNIKNCRQMAEKMTTYSRRQQFRFCRCDFNARVFIYTQLKRNFPHLIENFIDNSIFQYYYHLQCIASVCRIQVSILFQYLL
jgi:hypothetical protein